MVININKLLRFWNSGTQYIYLSIEFINGDRNNFKEWGSSFKAI